ncbi:MAG: 1-acyl-sn-glycerol-3-phosphate acyltransferase [Candidatus Symbiothrix sp.]|jgi:1-acyl-sn-glycerol-3-phosphate acyltransferase|nr:1-acyl-sn-glycerol-3-phosphate acyltransferase [Candidatus Symbiothrix sp.]
MKNTLILCYQILIWLPLMVISTLITALSCTTGCLLGGEKIFSYYPGKIWSQLFCVFTFSPVRVLGREKLKKNQSYVFVANHQGAYDIFLIYGYLGVPIKWIMKQSLRKIPFVGLACEKAGFIFVDNSSPVAAARTIKEAENRLSNGASIAIFPEGSRTHTGKLNKFKKGAYQMALDMHLPIVPVTINGSYEVMRTGSYAIHPHRMEMIIHDPIPTAHLPVGDLREAAQSIRLLADSSRATIEASLWECYR